MDLLSDYALCLGVCHSSLQKNVHLLKLDDPHMALTRRWHPGEQFEVGKWYRKDQRLYRKLEDDIVKTIIVRTMDSNAMGQSTFELVLPVYFVPDFSGIDLGGKLPMLKDPNKAAMPICPLFGQEGIEVLPPVKWSNGNGRDNIYSDALYALRINISYISGDTPVWTPQSVGQLKPWNYEQYPIVSQLCRETRTEGIVIDQVMKHFGMSCMQYCLITDKQAQLSIGVFSESKIKTVGEYLQFWPMQLDFYEFPLVLALDCPHPQESNNQSIIRPSQFIQKCASNTFKFKVERKEFEKLSQDNYHVSWLGKFIDAHQFVDDKLFQSIKDKNLVEIHSQPQWCLKKRSVCWIIIDDIMECNTSSSLQQMNLTRQQEAITSDQLIKSDKLRAISPSSEGSSNKSAMGTSSSLPSISSSPNAPLTRKKALAAFMTIRTEGGDPVLLFWDVNTEKFNRKCYAEFHTNLPLIPADFGKWYELTYWDVPNNERRIIVLDYRKAERKAVTHIRDEICAQVNFITILPPYFQFSTNRDRYINVWHAKFPCEAKNNYYEDRGWWPWLCRTCYPDLRDLSPPIVREFNSTPGTSKSVEIRNKEVLSPSLEELATKMKSSLALEEENIEDYSDTESISLLPIEKIKQDVNLSQQFATINKQKSASISRFPINSNTQTALAVLLTVRDNDDLVFLFFNGQEKKFKYRIYADPTHKLTIGNWYTISYKLNTAGLQNSQKIAITAAKLNSKGPVETRIYNRMIAQFNSTPAFLSEWHKSKWHNRAKTDVPDAKSPWWPKICITCYPNTNAELEEDESKVKAGKSKHQYTTIASCYEDELTDSDTESYVTGEVRDDLSNGDGSEEESPNITPTGTPKPNATANINYLVQCQFPGFSMTKLDTSNSPSESTKIETSQQNEDALNTNGPSKLSTFQLNGGFGSARLRRLQLVKSASSAKFPNLQMTDLNEYGTYQYEERDAIYVTDLF